jgi:ribosomal protein S18 acetylase RimI-like enzyme
MFEFREIRRSDLPELAEFWNRNVENDPMTVELLREKIFDDPDVAAPLALVVTENGPIVAFMVGVVRCIDAARRGWIKLFATGKAVRRRGLATQLLEMIETQLRQQAVARIGVLDSVPNYFQPGIDPFYTEAIAFVERRGFTKTGDTSNLQADLVHQNFNTDDEEKAIQLRGLSVRRATIQDKLVVMDFLKRYFKAWIPEISNMFNNNPVSLHLGFAGNELVAFSGHNGNNFNTGWFGPMGTHPHKRGLGLGGILLKRCMQDMQRQGLPHSIIPWVGPIPFYMHYIKSRVCRVFWQYEKKLI